MACKLAIEDEPERGGHTAPDRCGALIKPSISISMLTVDRFSGWTASYPGNMDGRAREQRREGDASDREGAVNKSEWHAWWLPLMSVMRALNAGRSQY